MRWGPLNLVVAYANLRPETAAAAGEAATYVDTGKDDEAYWRLLRDLWNRKRTFILLEQDILPPPGMLDELWACPAEWCGCPYPVGNIWGVFHGATKYSASLMRRHPEALRSFSSRYWQNLDSQLIAYIGRRQKESAHWHWPAARHLRFEPDHVFANCGDCGGPLRFPDLRAGPEHNRCPRCGRVPAYHPLQRAAQVQVRRADYLAKLRYIGRGQYLNGVPARDLETDDGVLIDECLDSGLYVRANAPKKKDAPAAPEPSDPAPEPPALVAEPAP